MSAGEATSTRARAAQLWWLVVVPIALAIVATPALVPEAIDDGGGALEGVARFAIDHAFVVAVALALYFGAVLQRLRGVLPFGHLLVAPVNDAKRETSGWRLVSLVGAVLVAALLAIVARQIAFEPSQVGSGSMLPTLQPFDRVLVDKTAYGVRLPGARQRLSAKPPRRGDVVVFRAAHALQGPGDLVKRVIGLPGDRVQVISGRPLINGWAVPGCDAGTFVYSALGKLTRGRLWVEFLDGRAHLTALTMGAPDFERPYEVKAGEVFVLGDNRGHSNDSRWLFEGRGGGVSEEAISGRVDRWLTRRSVSRLSVHGLLQPLDLGVRIPGVDVHDLEAGVAKCLARGPGAGGSSPPPAPAEVP